MAPQSTSPPVNINKPTNRQMRVCVFVIYMYVFVCAHMSTSVYMYIFMHAYVNIDVPYVYCMGPYQLAFGAWEATASAILWNVDESYVLLVGCFGQGLSVLQSL